MITKAEIAAMLQDAGINDLHDASGDALRAVSLELADFMYYGAPTNREKGIAIAASLAVQEELGRRDDNDDEGEW